MWLTIAKWLGLVAVALALVGVPIVWHGMKVDQAYQAGFVDGRNSVIHDNEMLKRNFEVKESEQAQIRQAENDKFQRQISATEKKLRDALAKEPVCPLAPDTVTILRNAANGIFAESGPDVPSGPPAEVSGHA